MAGTAMATGGDSIGRRSRRGRKRALQHESVRADTYRDVMPHWIILLTVVIVGWFALSVGFGLVLGWLVSVASRRRGLV
jgi:hypothetical protein